MRPLRSARLSRAAADRLLDGGPGPEPLRQLLTTAAGQGQWDELRGEEAARLAFIASADVGVAPDPDRHRSWETGRTLSRIMAAKAIAAVALTLGAGSAAVAATTNSFGDGSFGASTGQQSEPAATEERRTLVVDRMSDRAAEPASSAINTNQSAGSGARPESCQSDTADGCGAPATAAPPAPPSRRPAASVEKKPADIPSTTNRPSRRPSREPSGPPEEKNQQAADGRADNDTPRKQPPSQAVKKTDLVNEKSKAGAAAGDD